MPGNTFFVLPIFKGMDRKYHGQQYGGLLINAAQNKNRIIEIPSVSNNQEQSKSKEKQGGEIIDIAVIFKKYRQPQQCKNRNQVPGVLRRSTDSIALKEDRQA